MKIWQLNNGYTIFQVLQGRSNSFLISTSHGNVLVDTGLKFSRKKLIKNIKSLNLQPANIDFLILTHSHFDHCKNARFLKERFGCQLIIGESEMEFAIKGYSPAPRGTMWFSKLISWLGNKMGKIILGYEKFYPDYSVKQPFSLKKFGYDIDLISTPGHSSGSISIIANSEIGIVGDTMFGIFRNLILPPFADNKYELIESWKKLLATNCNLFLPGHGKAITRELIEKAFKSFKKLD
ncbi:MAG: MBL fold metallo-hydrolase [Bacteroidales bacterium]